MIVRPVELHLLKLCKSLSKKTVLVAVSGGTDSMALLYASASIKSKVPCHFIVAHIHHGRETNSEFRDQAKDFVSETCGKLKMEFVSNLDGSAASSSESDLRRFRLDGLKKLKDDYGADFVMMAHHSDDLLETRLIRLIRGTGPAGLTAMSEKRGAVLRPFLKLSKAQLESYLHYVGGRHLEDPSNTSVEYLRNWIRREWLPALDSHRPGSSFRLNQSLSNLAAAVESLDTKSILKCYENSKIGRQEFLVLSEFDKRRVLGAYLQHCGFKDYGLSHINELIKRLDVERKDLTFRLLKKIWLANAKHIWCE